MQFPSHKGSLEGVYKTEHLAFPKHIYHIYTILQSNFIECPQKSVSNVKNQLQSFAAVTPSYDKLI